MRRSHPRFGWALGFGLSMVLASGMRLAHAEAGSAGGAADAPATAPGRARWHPTHAFELEAHGVVGGFDEYGAGFGGGLRANVPLLEGWPFRGIDNGLSVGVGFDAVHYAAYHPNNNNRNPSRAVMAYYVPVYGQWNWWTGRVASFFIEAGLLYRHASYLSDCPTSLCTERSRVMPVGYLGTRFRIADHFSVTVRAGWPMLTLGVSWL